MDRYSPRLLRGIAAAGVSIFLVAGAAFAANAVLGAPGSASQDFVPAAATSPSGDSKVEATETAEPTETAKPTKTRDSTTGTAEPTETAKSGEKADGTGKSEASETPEPTETAEATRSPKATRTAEPTETPDVEHRSGDDNLQQSGENKGGDEHAGATATPTAGLATPAPAATAEPTDSHDSGGDGSNDGGNG